MYVSSDHPITRSLKAELQHSSTGSAECIMNDPGVQQPSQTFFTWVKARPQHRELHALLLTNSAWVLSCPTVICNKGCETGLSAYSPYPRRLESLIICWCSYKGSTFCSVIFKTLSAGPAGVELMTSCMITRCSTNWATGARYSHLAFQWKWGLRWPCYDRSLTAFVK